MFAILKPLFLAKRNDHNCISCTGYPRSLTNQTISHRLMLRLKYASPLTLLTSSLGSLPTNSNIVTTMLRGSLFIKSCPLQGPSISADKTVFTSLHVAKTLHLPPDSLLSGSILSSATVTAFLFFFLTEQA